MDKKHNKVNIVLFSLDDPIISFEFLSSILKKNNLDISLVVIPHGFFQISRIFKIFVMFFSLSFFKEMIFSLSKTQSVSNLLKENNTPVIYPKNINSFDTISKLKDAHPDYLLSFNCPQKFSNQLLNLPKQKCINIHFGMLPEYRGLSPIFHAVFNKEKEVGVTFHIMDSHFDNGPIIIQKRLDISKERSLFKIYKMALNLTCESLPEFSNLLKNQKFETIPNEINKSSYFHYPSLKKIVAYKFKLNKWPFLDTFSRFWE